MNFGETVSVMPLARVCKARSTIATDGPGVRSMLESCEKAREKRLSVVSGLCYRYQDAKQETVNETLLPLGKIEGADTPVDADATKGKEKLYEFVPSAESILEEVVPTSFKIKLFKCFLDAAVSEQVARMVAMKSASDNASDLIDELQLIYNKARQSAITQELSEIVAGAAAV